MSSCGEAAPPNEEAPPPAHDDSANELVLGRATNANQYHLNGTLDDFVLYGRVLSGDEIAAIHACTD